MTALCDAFACPACGAAIVYLGDETELRCPGCAQRYGNEEGIPRLFWPLQPVPEDGVTDKVKAFYEENPFPDYQELDSSASLKEKAGRGVFARLLDAQVPPAARVLEVGCGTGQLSNFLALAPERRLVATDMCLASLRLAQSFKVKNRIDNLTFAQMNLFHPALRPETFDVVLCNGVLHHTGAPFRGLQGLCRLARPGGFVVIGLYNSLGRLPTLIRRALMRIGGERLAVLDPRLRSAEVGATQKRSWLMDQYRHPHESRHSFAEVLRWFEAAGLELVGSLPSTRPFEPFDPDRPLFEPPAPPSALELRLVELGMLLRGGREGGLFVTIGRKAA
jgi:2-polyprenyl-3-methyl-5-hydroxy-6-metoxy-1,4-benzoquinol methylase